MKSGYYYRDYDHVKILVFLMDNAACDLEKARENAQESAFDKSYWEDIVTFWERELDRCIDDLKLAYH